MGIDVILYNVGRNLNRVYRTCFSFGVNKLILVGNSNDRLIKWELKGNLFQAKNNVEIIKLNKLPEVNNILALENFYKNSIYNIDWKDINTIIIGGETKGIPRKLKFKKMCCIPTINKFCLTVEASLAVGLSEYYRNLRISYEP